jgi:hypothetical protein
MKEESPSHMYIFLTNTSDAILHLCKRTQRKKYQHSEDCQHKIWKIGLQFVSSHSRQQVSVVSLFNPHRTDTKHGQECLIAL